MIKLHRSPPPPFLNDQKVAELTEEYNTTGKAVWNDDRIKIPLLEMSYGKCAYCECNLTEESKYMEVEHFEDKHSTPEKVVLWDNLLPACKRCNGHKSDHNVRLHPIINPCIDEPREHLKLHLYRLQGKTQIGKETIEVINLNDTERLGLKRYRIGEAIHEKIDTVAEMYRAYIETPLPRRANRCKKLVEGLLQECQPTSEYSALTATLLHTNIDFQQLIKDIRGNDNLWKEDMDRLYECSLELVLDER